MSRLGLPSLPRLNGASGRLVWEKDVPQLASLGGSGLYGRWVEPTQEFRGGVGPLPPTITLQGKTPSAEKALKFFSREISASNC